MTLRALVLGSAAGGGLPQWNCRAECSASAWEGYDGLKPATQSSLAVSADGEQWVLLNASPDLRSQILATPQLRPRADGVGLRNTPIRSVVLTNGDVDHVAGLLTMRERQAFTIWMTAEIATVLDRNPIFEVLDREVVTRKVIGLEEPFEPVDGIEARLFPVPGKVALWLEGEAGDDVVETDRMGEQTAGVELTANTVTAFYIPGCARMVPALADRLRGAPLVFFDGTVFHDDEMIRAGVGHKTGRRMGHMAMAGPEGSLAAFAGLEVGRKIYVHMNNTNPVWLPTSPERAEAEAAGWEIAHDGMEVSL